MSYLVLNKRQSTGKLIACTNFKNGTFVNLIKLDKPYKDGTKYAVIETTGNPFMSNGLFKNIKEAFIKYNLMVKNGLKEFGMSNGYISNTPEVKEYFRS